MFMCGPAFWQQFDEGGTPAGFVIYQGWTQSAPETEFTVVGAAKDARDEFIARLTGTWEAEDFEGFDAFYDLNLFGADVMTRNGIDMTIGVTESGNATLTVTSSIAAQAIGRFNTSANPHIDPDTLEPDPRHLDGISVASNYPLAFEFDPPIAAFGMFLTDVADFSGASKIQFILTKSVVSGGTTSTHDLDNSTSLTNAALHFWGFVDNTGATYSKVTLTRDLSSEEDTSALNDVIGVDDIIYVPLSFIA